MSILGMGKSERLTIFDADTGRQTGDLNIGPCLFPPQWLAGTFIDKQDATFANFFRTSACLGHLVTRRFAVASRSRSTTTLATSPASSVAASTAKSSPPTSLSGSVSVDVFSELVAHGSEASAKPTSETTATFSTLSRKRCQDSLGRNVYLRDGQIRATNHL